MISVWGRVNAKYSIVICTKTDRSDAEKLIRLHLLMKLINPIENVNEQIHYGLYTETKNGDALSF